MNVPIRSIKTLAAGIAAACLLAGCASITKPNSPDNFEPSMSQGVNAVLLGTVVSVHNVHIRSGNTGLATGGGALGGAAVGDRLGGVLGAVLGAIGGGVAGHAIEGKAGKQQAQQITIMIHGKKYKNGLISVTQATGPEFHVGEAVEIITGAKTCSDSYSYYGYGGQSCSTQPTRVMPLASSPGGGSLPTKPVGDGR
ncbi:MAG TPA: hypothetical protein VF292_08360 [Rhodanobacteraceae bacterium]